MLDKFGMSVRDIASAAQEAIAPRIRHWDKTQPHPRPVGPNEVADRESANVREETASENTTANPVSH